MEAVTAYDAVTPKMKVQNVGLGSVDVLQGIHKVFFAVVVPSIPVRV